MTDPIIDRLDQIKGRADTAADHVGKIAAREHRWTMSVPPLETDTDILLTQCLDTDVPDMVDALRGVLDLHRAVEVEPSDTICGGCSTPLPNGRYLPTVEWPCPSVKAMADALGIETEGGER